MDGPRFSVIIAAYNGARTLRRAIDSVLSQTYRPRELIVVDDGSVDETARVVGEFGADVVYRYQDNAGVSAARNLGASIARGDWLAFLDADDWYYPERLRWHAELIGADADLDFLTGDFDYCRPDGSVIRRSMESTEAGRRLLAQARGKETAVMSGDLLGLFVEQHFGDTHTLSVPRGRFLEAGGYPQGLAVCEDVHLLIRLCAHSRRVGVVCRPMAAYVIHADSATRSDPLRAQQHTVRALLALRRELAGAPPAVRAGLRRSLRRSRLDLAYVLVRRGERRKAVGSVLPSLVEDPGWRSLRDVLSIGRAALRSEPS